MIVDSEWERIDRKQSWPTLKYVLGFCQEKLKETTKPPFRIAGPGRGLNPVPRDLAFVDNKQNRAVIFTLRLVYAGQTALCAHWI
jgi:hypothetical protein